MTKRLPTFVDKGRVLQPDTCGPITQAIRAEKVNFQGLSHGHYPGRHMPARMLPELKTVGFFDAKRNQDWGTDWHYNEGVEICLVENGHVTFCVEQGEYQLGPNDLTVTRPWQPHRLGNPFVAATRLHWLMVDLGNRRPGEPWHWPPWLLFSAADRRELTTRIRHMQSPVHRADELMVRCFQRIASLIAAESASRQSSLLAVLVNEVFVLLLEKLRSGTGESATLDVSAEEIVRDFWENLCNDPVGLVRDWQLPELARECGLSATRFVDLTRHITNLPPIRFLRQCRLERAARLLIERPQGNVTEIALDCGFSSGQHFANAFRRQFGACPNVYRASHRMPSAGGRG